MYCDGSCIHSCVFSLAQAFGVEHLVHKRPKGTIIHILRHIRRLMPLHNLFTLIHCEASIAGVNTATCVPIVPLEDSLCCRRASASGDAAHSSSSKRTWST